MFSWHVIWYFSISAWIIKVTLPASLQNQDINKNHSSVSSTLKIPLFECFIVDLECSKTPGMLCNTGRNGPWLTQLNLLCKECLWLVHTRTHKIIQQFIDKKMLVHIRLTKRKCVVRIVFICSSVSFLYTGIVHAFAGRPPVHYLTTHRNV